MLRLVKKVWHWIKPAVKRKMKHRAVRYALYAWLCLMWIPARYVLALVLGFVLGTLLAVREATEEAVNEYRTVAYVFRKDRSNTGTPKCQNQK